MYFSAQTCPQKWQVRLSDQKSTNWMDPRNKLDKERAEFAVPWRMGYMGCMAPGADWPLVNVYIAIIAIENHHF